MGVEIFVSGKRKLRIQKYPDTCGRVLSVDLFHGSIKARLELDKCTIKA